MKKIYFVVFFCFILSSTSLLAQDNFQKLVRSLVGVDRFNINEKVTLYNFTLFAIDYHRANDKFVYLVQIKSDTNVLSPFYIECSRQLSVMTIDYYPNSIAETITVYFKGYREYLSDNFPQRTLLFSDTPSAIQSNESDYKADGKGKIKSYEGKATDIVIPSRINGVPITAIGESAFTNKSLTSVTIPAGVMSIESGAFCNNYLTKVEIPSSVTIIRSEAFENNQLTSVTIPKSVTIIEFGAFQQNRLSNVVIPYSVTSIGHYAFMDNQLTSVVIPDSVKSIGSGAFMNNQLTSITIPVSITSINFYAFAGNRLTSVTIPNSVTSIDDEAFEVNQLSSIIIPNSVTSIGRAAFSRNNLTSITIGANVKLGFKAPNNDIWPSFDNDFDDFYNKNGKKAGTYVYSNNRWIMK